MAQLRELQEKLEAKRIILFKPSYEKVFAACGVEVGQKHRSRDMRQVLKVVIVFVIGLATLLACASRKTRGLTSVTGKLMVVQENISWAETAILLENDVSLIKGTDNNANRICASLEASSNGKLEEVTGEDTEWPWNRSFAYADEVVNIAGTADVTLEKTRTDSSRRDKVKGESVHPFRSLSNALRLYLQNDAEILMFL